MNVASFFVCGLCAAIGASASGAILLDFETDDFGASLVNGQDILSPDEFGNLVSISASGPNAGAAIFDSDLGGPNDFVGAPDPDLMVNLGNVLILQRNDGASDNQTVPGFFDTPDDDEDGGDLFFAFIAPVEMLSLDLIDINGNGAVTITLFDANNLTRVFSVPDHWTGDPEFVSPGWATLSLTTLAPQVGPNGPIATAVEDAGFDPTSVLNISINFRGSAALDNIHFVPAPGGAALLALAGLAGVRRRR